MDRSTLIINDHVQDIHSILVHNGKILEEIQVSTTVQPTMEQSHCRDRRGINGQTGKQRKQVHTLSSRLLQEDGKRSKMAS